MSKLFTIILVLLTYATYAQGKTSASLVSDEQEIVVEVDLNSLCQELLVQEEQNELTLESSKIVPVKAKTPKHGVYDCKNKQAPTSISSIDKILLLSTQTHAVIAKQEKLSL